MALAFSWTIREAWLSAAAGGFLGFAMGIRMARSRLRLMPGLASLGLAWMALAGIASCPARLPWLAAGMGPQLAYVCGESASWGLQALLGVAALCFASGRYTWLCSLESLAVTLMIASPLAAHRNGALNRPSSLMDGLWANNLSPVPWLYALGFVLFGLVIVLNLGRQSKAVSKRDVVLLVALLTCVCAFAPLGGAPQELDALRQRQGDGNDRDPRPAWGPTHSLVCACRRGLAAR